MSIQFRPIKDINLYKSYLTRKYELIYDKNIEIYKNEEYIVIISKNRKEYEQCVLYYNVNKIDISLCYINVFNISNAVYEYYCNRIDMLIENINILYNELGSRGLNLTKYRFLQYLDRGYKVINDYVKEYEINKEMIGDLPINGIRDIGEIVIEYVL
jgi:hypothetical protein